MPELCRFLGIIITMYSEQFHNISHFHVRYNEFKASISIDGMQVLAGNLPPRVLGLVIEWALMHTDELKENWNLLQSGKPINKIEPLV